MKKQEKVSILVAVYTIEKFIGKCIQSLIDQDYKNIEIILVDDCSKDKSGKICDDYAKKDSRIKVIHHEKNKRLPGVRNTGLDNATGDYIVFVDGDDWLAPDFVSYMLGILKETNSDMAINLVNFTTRDLEQVEETKAEVWNAEKATAELLFSHLTIGAWNKIYKRKLIEENKIRFHDDLFTAEGYRFVSDIVQRVNLVGVGCRKVYYYRLNNTESATTKYDVRQSMGAIKAATEIKNDLIIKTPYVLGAINTHIWLNHFWNIRQICALKLEKENETEFKESIKYVKKNAWKSAKSEPSLQKKFKYILVGICPVIIAKAKNKYFNYKLKKDVKKYNKKEK